MQILPRENYASRIDAWIGKEQIIVLTGQRRVGKSFVMKDFVQRHRQEPDANIIYIDKEKIAFKDITASNELDDYVSRHFQAGKHNYILIDEVQDIAGWEQTVRSYRAEDDTDIIVTGSNSKMLSSELSTLLAGRYVEIHIQSLSYTEFMLFHGLEDSDATLWKYLVCGGLPGLRAIGLDDDDMVREYLSGVFNTIMLKDIIERNKIRNIPFLNNLIAFLADSTGKLNSASSIVKYMKSQGEEISANIVISYSAYFAEAYLTANVPRYDIHGKKLLETAGKTYFGDVGLRNYIVGGEREKDVEKVMENVVYQHLRRLGYDVTVGQLRAGEVDFVCTRPTFSASGEKSRVYVQVAYIIATDDTREREFGTLQNIPDSYPKYVISATPLLQASDYNGVTHLSLRKFLMEGFGND
jgi:uncharacterized protein